MTTKPTFRGTTPRGWKETSRYRVYVGDRYVGQVWRNLSSTTAGLWGAKLAVPEARALGPFGTRAEAAEALIRRAGQEA